MLPSIKLCILYPNPIRQDCPPSLCYRSMFPGSAAPSHSERGSADFFPPGTLSCVYPPQTPAF